MWHERLELSLGVIDPAIEVGTEVTLIWGEPDGGSLKVSVERPHKQVEVRATVSPVPFSAEAREHYAEGSPAASSSPLTSLMGAIDRATGWFPVAEPEAPGTTNGPVPGFSMAPPNPDDGSRRTHTGKA